MTAIKIYYKDVPGHNLISSKDGARVYSRNIRSADEDYKNSLFPILDLLGIDYEFSKDADAIPCIDVGSLHPSSQEFLEICTSASNNYKKSIIFSTQEPWQWFHVEKILNQFNNLFLFDAGTPLPDNGVYHNRYGNFPAYLCRSLTPRLNVTIISGDDLSYKKEYVKLFSCLMARWRVEKHLLFSMLYYFDMIEDNYVTYNSLINPAEPEFMQSDNFKNQIVNSFRNTLDLLLPNFESDFKNFSYDGLTKFNSFSLTNDIFIDEAPFNFKLKHRPSIKWYDPSVRSQPKFIFEDSCFSLVCESFSGIELGQDINGKFTPVNARSLISEKSIIPIMNGHPWLVFGEAGFHTTLEDYGFISHDELFNLDFDLENIHGQRLEAIRNNLSKLEIKSMSDILLNHDSDTNKKIRHNRKNIFHTSSTMWKKLNNNIIHMFDRFRDLNV